jgi:hypothetical protein
MLRTVPAQPEPFAATLLAKQPLRDKELLFFSIHRLRWLG